MRTRSLLLALTTVLAGLSVVASPAEAEEAAPPAITISAVDTSTPGHVVVTVQSESPHADLWLEDADGQVGAPQFTELAADHSGTLDLPTWGLSGEVAVVAEPCEYSDRSWCYDGAADRHTFVPTDVVPTVIWDAKTRLDAADSSYTVTIDDPQGDGSTLQVGLLTQSVVVRRTGSTTVHFQVNGIGHATLFRCGQGGRCTPVATSPEIEARTWMYVAVDLSSSGPVSPRPDHPVDVTARVWARPGDYTLDWWVDDAPGVGESGIPVSIAETSGPESDVGSVSLPVDLRGVTSGQKYVRVRLSREYDGFGTLVGTPPKESGSIIVDVTPPAVSVSVSGDSLYPYRDGYRDSVLLSLSSDAPDARIDVLDSSHQVVKSFTGSWDSQFTWTGSIRGGGTAKPGRYTFRITATDELGNRTVREQGAVAVSGKRLVSKSFHRRITAAGAMVHSSVGSCGTLSRPASRGWRGSLGLYSDLRCARGSRQWLVETTNGIRVPAAFRYGTLRVSVDGGAARSQPGSYLFLDHYATRSGWGDHDRRLSYELGAHRGRALPGSRYVDDHRWTYWSVYTGGGARYDVRSFVVDLDYQLLR